MPPTTQVKVTFKVCRAPGVVPTRDSATAELAASWRALLAPPELYPCGKSSERDGFGGAATLSPSSSAPPACWLGRLPAKAQNKPQSAPGGRTVPDPHANIRWCGKPKRRERGRLYYDRAVLPNGCEVSEGAFVQCQPPDPEQPLYLARVAALWENVTERTKMVECQWFFRPEDLGPQGSVSVPDLQPAQTGGC